MVNQLIILISCQFRSNCLMLIRLGKRTNWKIIEVNIRSRKGNLNLMLSRFKLRIQVTRSIYSARARARFRNMDRCRAVCTTVLVEAGTWKGRIQVYRLEKVIKQTCWKPWQCNKLFLFVIINQEFLRIPKRDLCNKQLHWAHSPRMRLLKKISPKFSKTSILETIRKVYQFFLCLNHKWRINSISNMITSFTKIWA